MLLPLPTEGRFLALTIWLSWSPVGTDYSRLPQWTRGGWSGSAPSWEFGKFAPAFGGRSPTARQKICLSHTHGRCLVLLYNLDRVGVRCQGIFKVYIKRSAPASAANDLCCNVTRAGNR